MVKKTEKQKKSKNKKVSISNWHIMSTPSVLAIMLISESTINTLIQKYTDTYSSPKC